MSKTNPFGPEGWTPDGMTDLQSKTYLITGANTGAGFEASKLLLAKGARVVMLNRNAEKSTTAIKLLKQTLGQHIDISFILMDLADLTSVRRAAALVNSEIAMINGFIANAAVAQVASQQRTAQGFESQRGINHYGHFLLTYLRFDKLEASQGRIVIVGSNGHRMGLKRLQLEDKNFDHNYGAHISYCHSKFAQMMFAYELERRATEAQLAVSVHVCHPGMAKTTLAHEESAGLTKLLLKIATPFAQSAERGAWPEVLCATEPQLKPKAYYGPTKRGEMAGPVGECQLGKNVLDPQQAELLWQASEKATGIAWRIARHQH